jgi:predicted phage terminase large subunit-like protein
LVLSWDTASKIGGANDYSVGTAWAILENKYYLLDVVHGRWEFPELLSAIVAQAEVHKAKTILIEDANSGTAVIQSLRQQSSLNIIGIKPKLDRETRAHQQTPCFQSERVIFPSAAPWLASLETELFGFPFARYDDQIDSIVQFLQWASHRIEKPTFFAIPIIVSWPREPGWGDWKNHLR